MANVGDLIRINSDWAGDCPTLEVGHIAEIVRIGGGDEHYVKNHKFDDGEDFFLFSGEFDIFRKAGEEDEQKTYEGVIGDSLRKCDTCSKELGETCCTSPIGGSFCSAKCADDMVEYEQALADREAELVASKPQADAVNHPNHYTQGRFETIEIIEEVTQGYSDGYVSYCVGNALKYLARAPFKHESPAEDIAKARAYLDFALKRLA